MKYGRIRVVFLLFGLSLMSACASGPRIWVAPEHDTAIANQFVDWIKNNPDITLQSKTVQIRRGQGPFGDAVKTRMKDSGYFIQTIPDHFVAPNLVSYSAEFMTRGKGKAVNYTLRVGSIEISRQYRYRSFSNNWLPVNEFAISRVNTLERPLGDELVTAVIDNRPKATKAVEEPIEKKNSSLIEEIPIQERLIKESDSLQTSNRNAFSSSIALRLKQLEKTTPYKIEPGLVQVKSPSRLSEVKATPAFVQPAVKLAAVEAIAAPAPQQELMQEPLLQAKPALNDEAMASVVKTSASTNTNSRIRSGIDLSNFHNSINTAVSEIQTFVPEPKPAPAPTPTPTPTPTGAEVAPIRTETGLIAEAVEPPITLEKKNMSISDFMSGNS